MTTYSIIDSGNSRSFPAGDAFLSAAQQNGEVVIHIGNNPSSRTLEDGSKLAVLVELGTECLGQHTGENSGTEGSNVVGFARFRLGAAEPTRLIEIVRQPQTSEKAIEAARAIFEKAGFEVSLCNDSLGRIVDRLIRPQFNEALRSLDEGLGTAEQMDLTVKLGLGYPEGYIELLERTGLEHHYDVTKVLFDTYGLPQYAPARRAGVAKARSKKVGQ